MSVQPIVNLTISSQVFLLRFDIHKGLSICFSGTPIKILPWEERDHFLESHVLWGGHTKQVLRHTFFFLYQLIETDI